MSKTYDIAIAGATGAVGEALLRILEQREFPVGTLFPLASERSIGRTVKFCGKDLQVQSLNDFDFRQVQLGLFSAGAAVSAEVVPRAVEAGAVVIDNTSQFRYDDDVPLVVPECNAERIADYSQRGIIANPNCSTIQLVVALKPIQDVVGIERINVSTYQAVSGAGRRAIETLTEQTRAVLSGNDLVVNSGVEKSVVFNVVPKIDRLLDNGFTKEEMKMIWETRKILESADIMVNPTCVRVPVFWGHSESIHLETRKKITVHETHKLLNSAPGIVVLDGESPGAYPTAVTEAAHRDAVFVGRIREDLSHPRGLNLWVVSDNLRKGAALNSVQIAEILVNEFL
ncbi:MAG: aspartate-semialdehyde dehydrogenase [Pseudomonadota bacterium]|nr:aspartate-semialdehyde dehydrogenase [Pseudomonadota bacterium]